MKRNRPRYGIRLLTAVCLVVLLAGCEKEDVPPDYVARVGDRHLLRDEVDRAIRSTPIAQDSVDARQQIVEQWVTTELLHQEAQRRGLRQNPEVRRALEESERAVLVNALVTQLYEENPVTPTTSELQAYFENNKEQLRLRESFARVRYLRASSRAHAEAARELLQQAPPEGRDSIWTIAIEQHSSDRALSDDVSSTYFPESRLFLDRRPLREAMSGLLVGQIAPVVETDGTFHVMQLVERIPARSVPEPAWIEDELVRRLVIQGRKQLYARQVQRLRNEALAREDLEVR